MSDAKLQSKIDITFGAVWKLKVDERNYILMRKRGKTWGTEGYYNTLEQVFSTVFEKTVRESEAKTINKLLTVIKHTREEMRKCAAELESKWGA